MASTLKARPGPAPSGGEALQVATGTTLKLAWYDSVVPSFWSMVSTQASTSLDTSGSVVLPENARGVMKVGDFIFCLVGVGGSVERGSLVVHSVNASTGAVDLRAIALFGASNPD